MSALTGNAKKADPNALRQEYGAVLAPDEEVHAGYILVRDVFMFTSRRLLLIDKQGITGKKTEFHSVPYRSITSFSVETAGPGIDDGEMKIWITGQAAPIQREFSKGVNVHEVQAILAAFVAR